MMNYEKMGAYTHNGEHKNFNFNTSLSAYDKLKFVRSVTDILVDGTAYNYVIRDLVFNFYIIDIMSDVDTKEFKESSFFVNDVELFLEETNIIEIVKANMEVGLLEELNKAVDLNIEYLTGIHPSPIADSLASLLSTLEKKINEVDLTSMTEMAQKFAGMTGELTPESIMNAYMNSDAHKKNLAEIEESKKNKAEIAKKLDKAIKETNAEAKVKSGKKK